MSQNHHTQSANTESESQSSMLRLSFQYEPTPSSPDSLPIKHHTWASPQPTNIFTSALDTVIAELKDPSLGSQHSNDIHDDLLTSHDVYVSHPDLPATTPQHARLLNQGRYWSLRNDNTILVYRDSNTVYTGLYRTLGFVYLWGALVKTEISGTGTWTDVWAAGQGTTRLGVDGVPVWDSWSGYDEEERTMSGKKVVAVGRWVAHGLMNGEARVWKSEEKAGEALEWCVDGVVRYVVTKKGVVEV
ncbi:hypothetical protein M011DRAFT_476680 [Sporormia fimetaria CBS 119925]|uniref:Uncharacterized protein n=1 Tax=Sporormia fimetaria CBS 119925 TaxID=1340428 RepID=A0A6A6VE56_9PLEO|nr:hypothetical protein M011DRAFT_476680 [Sporormia fimetaria CBS 119925]